MKTKTLVTGGAGFIGSHLTDKLIALGYEVIVVDNLMLGRREFVNPDAQFHQVDIREYAILRELCKGVDVVFHAAADPRLPISVENPLTTHDINVTGTLNVLLAAYEAGVKKVIFSSSCAVYGDQAIPFSENLPAQPLNPYGLHKFIGEEYCRLFSKMYNLTTVSLRYFNVFGPRKLDSGSYPMVIPIFLGQHKRGEKLTVVGSGEATRDYVYVSDVVEANIKAWQSDISDGRPINIGSGREVSVNQIAELIGGEIMHLPPRLGEMERVCADNTLARTLLNWQPTISLEQGLEILRKEWSDK
jgi:nucleoside-diphosphate-sugar epimerase